MEPSFEKSDGVRCRIRFPPRRPLPAGDACGESNATAKRGGTPATLAARVRCAPARFGLRRAIRDVPLEKTREFWISGAAALPDFDRERDAARLSDGILRPRARRALAADVGRGQRDPPQLGERPGLGRRARDEESLLADLAHRGLEPLPAARGVLLARAPRRRRRSCSARASTPRPAAPPWCRGSGRRRGARAAGGARADTRTRSAARARRGRASPSR